MKVAASNLLHSVVAAGSRIWTAFENSSEYSLIDWAISDDLSVSGNA